MSNETNNLMDRPSLLVLVRHAESERNRVKKNNRFLPDDETRTILDGIPDHKVPLTPFGLLQTKSTGIALKERFGLFDVVYHSEYVRTKLTQEGCFAAYTEEERGQMKFRSSHLVRERSPGYTYDMTTEEAEHHFPWLQKYWDLFGQFYAVPPGGESQEQVCLRVYQFIGMLMRIRAGQKVCVFTHGGTIRAFRYLLEGWTPDQYAESYDIDRPENCGVTVYRFSPKTKRLELEEYNKVYWKEHQ